MLGRGCRGIGEEEGEISEADGGEERRGANRGERRGCERSEDATEGSKRTAMFDSSDRQQLLNCVFKSREPFVVERWPAPSHGHVSEDDACRDGGQTSTTAITNEDTAKTLRPPTGPGISLGGGKGGAAALGVITAKSISVISGDPHSVTPLPWHAAPVASRQAGLIPEEEW
ncbi:hypothetical protein BV898_17592 [Hypsibius exemplaris]|uniref:Uncharacterized protein n=1 Tax=Hypsibius exemplaris TaxID=2072580 RepID=A0A9X6NHI7_HYPEX|nr:hypothetical protein BV898_17592 [Hypsibius exemplaris]